ncbi:5-oxoprolinase subunit PxpA [Sulfurospirillum sp. 1612]|uniref:5-oxoprolinase subunit PxpA n=1 Tax=Sulfurospirillum sp. 1612 TaxID=3094835 RepID=UPI002F94855E
MIKLNCDMGESFGAWKMGLDEAVMPLIDMSNIACGFHASDPVIMNQTVKMAVAHDVTIGAHVAYPDLVGFGRRSLACTHDEIESMVIYQIGALAGISQANNTKVSYVKPHGALYNDMMKDVAIFESILKAIAQYDKNLKLMILSSAKNETYAKIANQVGVDLIYEVFADRAYMEDGSLMPRSMPHAVLESSDDVMERLIYLSQNGVIKAHTGKELALRADCICVHGDNAHAVEIVKAMREYLS